MSVAAFSKMEDGEKDLKANLERKIDLLLIFFKRNIDLLLIFFLFIIKMVLILVNFPNFTTDLFRALMYGEAVWKYGFEVYDLYPNDLNPNGGNTYLTQTFAYPVFMLLFFSVFALLPFAEISVKLFLASLDVLIYVETKKDFGIKWAIAIQAFQALFTLYGLPEGITFLFILYSIRLYRQGSTGAAYLVAIVGFFWKYVPIFVIPYFLLNDYRTRNWQWIWDKRFSAGLIGIISLGLSPLLFSDYIWTFIKWQVRQTTSIDTISPGQLSQLEQGVYATYQRIGWQPDFFRIGHINPAALTLLVIFSYVLYRVVKREIEFIPLMVSSFLLVAVKQAMMWYFLYCFACVATLTLNEKRKFFWVYLGAFVIGLGYFGILIVLSYI